jgi:putative MATE family efflux protein
MAQSLKKIVRITKAAIKGEFFDFTEIDIRKAIILLAIPMMLELMLESVFAVVDIYFVNKLGADAVSAVGLTESVITIVYSIGIGLSAGATAMVARRVGEKDNDAASKAGAQAIMMALLVSVILGIVGYMYSNNILKLMGANQRTIAIGADYCSIMLAGNMAIILLFLINGIFRGAGNASVAMKSLWVGNIFNIILDPLFIFGIGFFPKLGVTGAAVATTTGRCIGVLYQCYHLYKARDIIKMKRSHFVPNFKIMKGLVEIASPATFQFIIASASWIVLAAMVAKFGSDASAGYQTAIRLVVFFILPAWGMSNAVATLVGQNLGANFPDRAEKSVFLASKYNAVFMAVVSLIFLFLSRPLLSFFIPAGQVQQLHYAEMALQIISSGYIFYGIGMVATQAFNGAGDTKTPTLVYFIGFWLFQIPFAYFMQKFTTWGIVNILIAIPIAETLIAIIIYILFRRGKWKLVKV